MLIKFGKIVVIVGMIIIHSFNIQAQTLNNTSSDPNIILIMADDLGFGDVGYNGNGVIQTPNLDNMAATGLQFNRFYAASAVCSPTRGSVLTGRHPERYGITFANEGFMKQEEITLAEAVKKRGYTTGHFGKWHLGTMNKYVIESNRGGYSWSYEVYSPPWNNGFDVSFSTESKVPTWDPMWVPSEKAAGVGADQKQNDAYGTYYWTGEGVMATKNLEGDDSRIIMDRALSFIESSVDKNKLFLAVIWFHTPHSPVVAGSKYKKMYAEYDENKQHYYGTITAMDDQIGRLRTKLRDLNINQNTLLFFTSDNGPAGMGGGTRQIKGGRQQGITGLFRGRKGSLYEGGIRVPGLLEWPSVIKQHQEINVPVVTSDYYSTITDILNLKIPNQPRPIDGISLLPLIKGNMQERGVPIGFTIKDQRAWMDDRYKIYSRDEGESFELYDLVKDPSEKRDLSKEMSNKVERMKAKLKAWLSSLQRSMRGNDYSN